VAAAPVTSANHLRAQPFASLLPLAIVAPGAPVEPITPEVARATGLPPDCLVCGGTTDSIAAFLAAGVTEVGEVSEVAGGDRLAECDFCSEVLEWDTLAVRVWCCSYACRQ
jgi:hypothetical protein